MKGKGTAISPDVPDFFRGTHSIINESSKPHSKSSKRITVFTKNQISSESPNEFHIPSIISRGQNPAISMCSLPLRRGSLQKTFYDQTYMKTSSDLHVVYPSMSIDLSSIKRTPPKTKIEYYQNFNSHMNNVGFGKYKGIYSFRADQPKFLRIDADSEVILRSSMYNSFAKRKPINQLRQSLEDYRVDENLISLTEKIQQLRSLQENKFTKSLKKLSNKDRSRSMEMLMATTTQSFKR